MFFIYILLFLIIDSNINSLASIEDYIFDKNFINYNNSWILNSEFNYNKPKYSILNLAYPSAIAQYYVTIMPPNSKYLFIGDFLQENLFESSLTVYTQDGNINYDYPSLDSYYDKNINITIDNNSSKLQYVFQRYYANMNYYTKKDFLKNLATVYDLKNDIMIPQLDSIRRDYYSISLDNPIKKIISHISPVSNKNYFKFYLPADNTNGLFPDPNHYYLYSNLGKFKILQISGQFISSKITPYMDFITVDQLTTETNQGIPFYDLKEDYKVYIVNPNITKQELDKYNITKCISWNKTNEKPGIIFRIIDYSGMGLTNCTGPLDPYQTKKSMETIHGINFYPEIKIIS